MAQDPYKILGVSRGSSEDEVKKAYKAKARQYHPDLNKDANAEDKFKEVNGAFEVLGNPEKRKMYDEFGEDAERMGFDPEKARQYRAYSSHLGGGRGGGGGFGGGFGQGGGGLGGLGDIFGQFFGGRGGGGARARRPQAGANVATSLTIDLLESLRGAEIELNANLPSPCTTCSGSEALACHTCGGRGATYQPTQLKVRIPAGVVDGGKIRLGGKGEPGIHGGPPGDLLITVHLRPHPFLRREDNDLYLTLPITVVEAVGGATLEVPTLNGAINMKIPPGSQSGQRLRVRGKGAPSPRGGERGNLYVELAIQVPDQLDEATQKATVEAAKQLAPFYTTDVREKLTL